MGCLEAHRQALLLAGNRMSERGEMTTDENRQRALDATSEIAEALIPIFTDTNHYQAVRLALAAAWLTGVVQGSMDTVAVLREELERALG